MGNQTKKILVLDSKWKFNQYMKISLRKKWFPVHISVLLMQGVEKILHQSYFVCLLSRHMNDTRRHRNCDLQKPDKYFLVDSVKYIFPLQSTSCIYVCSNTHYHKILLMGCITSSCLQRIFIGMAQIKLLPLRLQIDQGNSGHQVHQ